MWTEVFAQYGIVIFAFAAIIALKFYVLNKRVKLQADGFIDPSQCIDKLAKEVVNGDIKQILQSYVNNSVGSLQRYRNIAILVAYINSKQKQFKKCQSLTTLLKREEKLNPTQKKYKQYIVKNTSSWG